MPRSPRHDVLTFSTSSSLCLNFTSLEGRDPPCTAVTLVTMRFIFINSFLHLHFYTTYVLSLRAPVRNGNLSMMRPLAYLPACCVSPKKSKAVVEPGINLMESQLPLGRLRDSLNSPVLSWKLVQFLSWEKFAFSTKFGDTIRSLLLVPVPSGCWWWRRITPRLI